ncbi:alpha/beta hydrolase [Sutterella sp.]|uniref:alpha/beta hydrolase n=1 Tax=Sutterella sp. TaxID=1981025 RepID=UPI0026DEC5F6|nr:alpha/beta hydrolase [Sutterella sp.]MDO5531880.1 alpha/beta hydrolase [Sutterella sp.]
MKKTLLAAALCALCGSALSAAAAEVIPLWPDGAPNRSAITEPERTDEKGNIYNVTEGRMEVLPAKNPNGRAVILIPGGGYGTLSMASMDGSFAPFLNDQGFTVFMLKYRLPKGNPEVPLADANRAVELVRGMAGKYGIRTVGVMGASAGGHLAAISSVKCSGAACPDFSILIYPNITMMQEETMPKSSCRKNLIGEERSVKYDAAFSAYKHVSLTTPPAFIAVSAQDQFAGALGSLLYTRAMIENDRPVSLHVYPTGNHGWRIGKTENFPDGDHFRDDLAAWLKTLP